MIDLSHAVIADLPAVEVGPGCIRRDLAGFNGSRAWVVEIEAGHVWPHPDQHDAQGEFVLVLEGDLIEDGKTYEAGSCLVYGPNSVHRPMTRHGVRLFGLNAA